MTQLDHPELLSYTRDAALILQQAIRLYHAGQTCFYRVAAVELRLLVCDTTRLHGQLVSLALVKRLWPETRLRALGSQAAGAGLALEDWLEQKLPPGDMTVRQFIRVVCDQDGGAHVDSRRHSTLPEQCPTGEWIIQLSEIVLETVMLLIESENSSS